MYNSNRTMLRRATIRYFVGPISAGDCRTQDQQAHQLPHSHFCQVETCSPGKFLDSYQDREVLVVEEMLGSISVRGFSVQDSCPVARKMLASASAVSAGFCLPMPLMICLVEAEAARARRAKVWADGLGIAKPHRPKSLETGMSYPTNSCSKESSPKILS